MLHLREQNHIVRAEKFSAPRLRHQVNAFRRPARKDDLVRARRPHVSCNSRPRCFVSLRRARAQLVQTSMHIRVVVFVIGTQRLDDRARLLRRRRIIEINQRMPMHLLIQDREIFPERLPIRRLFRNLMHPSMCGTLRGAPTHLSVAPRARTKNCRISGRCERPVGCFGVKTKARMEERSERPFRIETVLVPTDFSEESFKAIAYARAFLNRFSATAHLVYVHDIDFAYAVPAMMTSSPLISGEDVERRLRKDLEKLGKQFELSGSTQARHVRTGRAYRQICEVANEIGAELIVIATHGRTGLRRLVLGSTAERVVQHAPCPVLVVREREREFLEIGKGKGAAPTVLRITTVLVPIDFSDSSREGLLYAISFARRFGASLLLLHAIQVQPFIPADGPATHERMPAPGVIERAARLRARKFLKQVDFAGVKYKMEIQSGQPAHEICRFAESANVELIITATHGQTGLAHVLIGSTAEHVVRYAHSPVLVVPTADATAQRQRDVRKREATTEERS